MPTVREIAKKTGLSPATVSRALTSHPDVSHATRELVLSAAEKTGYLDDSIRGKFCSVGYVVVGNSRVWEYDWMLMDGILEGIKESRLDLQLIDLERSKRDDETYRQFFLRRGLRGVVLRTIKRHQAICDQILAEKFPSVVVADRFEDRDDVNYVCCDSGSEMGSAVHHLADLGHKRIALVLHRRADRDHIDRRDGFMEACRQRDVEPSDELILGVIANLEGGRTAINRLMSLSTPPTAVCFTDPLSGIGALLRAQEVGLRIPDDLSIVGFDDGYARHRVHPTLTAVCQDTRAIGLEAGQWLGRRIQGGDEGTMRQVLEARLEINQTTGVPPTKSIRLQPNGSVIS